MSVLDTFLTIYTLMTQNAAYCVLILAVCFISISQTQKVAVKQ